MPRAFRGLTWAELAALLLCACIAAIVAFRLLVPASVWFDVGNITVSNARTCESLTVHYPREIRHRFEGEWRVQVYRAVPGGWLHVASTPTHRLTYEVDAVLPANDLVAFDWFTAAGIDCADLGPGIYRLAVLWGVNVNSWGGVLERTVRRYATFEVLG